MLVTNGRGSSGTKSKLFSIEQGREETNLKWCDCVFLPVGSEGSSVVGPVVGGVIAAAAVVLIAIILFIILIR